MSDWLVFEDLKSVYGDPLTKELNTVILRKSSINAVTVDQKAVVWIWTHGDMRYVYARPTYSKELRECLDKLLKELAE